MNVTNVNWECYRCELGTLRMQIVTAADVDCECYRCGLRMHDANVNNIVNVTNVLS